MATHSSMLAWEIPWTERPGCLQSMRSKEWDTTEQLSLPTSNWSKGFLTQYSPLLLLYKLVFSIFYFPLLYSISLK